MVEVIVRNRQFLVESVVFGSYIFNNRWDAEKLQKTLMDYENTVELLEKSTQLLNDLGNSIVEVKSSIKMLEEDLNKLQLVLNNQNLQDNEDDVLLMVDGSVKFHEKFYNPIKEGVKTQTMRLACKKLDVNEGDLVTALFPGLSETLKIKILKIGCKQMKSINKEDALLEGYAGVGELREDLRKFYPNITRFDRLYYYKFELISK